MYNIVTSKERDGIYLSIFDQNGNEIQNNRFNKRSEVYDFITKNKYIIENYINSYEAYDFDNHVFMLMYSKREKNENQQVKSVRLIVNEGDLIANESFYGYGLNRYLHRQFLKLQEPKPVMQREKSINQILADQHVNWEF